MKKWIIILGLLLSLIMTGCNNEFAKQEYDSSEKILQQEDRYAKETSIFNPVDGGYLLTISKFDGRETLWSTNMKEEQEIEIDFSFSLTEGQAKIVHIDAEGNITTLLESSPETSTKISVTQTVSLKSGENRLKLVGYDCEALELEMLFEEP